MITLAPARPSDAEAIAEIAAEMDRFYGAVEIESAETRVAQISAALFNASPSACALLAWDGENLAGFASYSFLWPAIGLTRSLYLKELYVSAAARRAGVGRVLMQGLCDIATENSCSRVEWTTDSDNSEAQQFYAELGVAPRRSKIFYRIEGDELTRLANL